MDIRTYVRLHVRTMYAYMYICMDVCMYACLAVCMQIDKYILVYCIYSIREEVCTHANDRWPHLVVCLHIFFYLLARVTRPN